MKHTGKLMHYIYLGSVGQMDFISFVFYEIHSRPPFTFKFM